MSEQQRTITRLTGQTFTTHCITCDHRVENSDRFCRHCGAALSTQSEINKQRIPVRRHPPAFCTHCGERLSHLEEMEDRLREQLESYFTPEEAQKLIESAKNTPLSFQLERKLRIIPTDKPK